MAITPRNQRSNAQRRRRLRARFGEEGVTWRGPACQRIEQRGSGVRASVTAWVRLCVRERENPGGLAGPVSLLGQNRSADLFPFLYSFSFSNLTFWNGFQMNS